MVPKLGDFRHDRADAQEAGPEISEADPGRAEVQSGMTRARSLGRDRSWRAAQLLGAVAGFAVVAEIDRVIFVVPVATVATGERIGFGAGDGAISGRAHRAGHFHLRAIGGDVDERESGISLVRDVA